VGFPVVPDVVWMRTISFKGTANNPKGYPSRRSCFFVKGMFWILSSVFIDDVVIPASVRRFLKKPTFCAPGLLFSSNG
jgi:hypothetical protein